MCKTKIIFAFIALVHFASAANILYIHTILSPSHHMWNRVLAKELANRGHNVTFLSVDKPKDDHKNLHYVVLENVYENYYGNDNNGGKKVDLLEMARESRSNRIKGAMTVTDWCVPACAAIMKADNGLKQILSYPDNFFEIIVNDFPCGPCILSGIAHRFNYPPTVGVTAFLNPPFTDLTIGGHKYPAYVPHFIINFSNIMNFYERIYNHLLYFVERM
jgi:hypothetical protein